MDKLKAVFGGHGHGHKGGEMTDHLRSNNDPASGTGYPDKNDPSMMHSSTPATSETIGTTGATGTSNYAESGVFGQGYSSGETADSRQFTEGSGGYAASSTQGDALTRDAVSSPDVYGAGTGYNTSAGYDSRTTALGTTPKGYSGGNEGTVDPTATGGYQSGSNYESHGYNIPSAEEYTRTQGPTDIEGGTGKGQHLYGEAELSGLGETEKAAAVRRYEAGHGEGSSGNVGESLQKTIDENTAGDYGSTSGQTGSSDYSSGQTGYISTQPTQEYTSTTEYTSTSGLAAETTGDYTPQQGTTLDYSSGATTGDYTTSSMSGGMGSTSGLTGTSGGVDPISGEPVGVILPGRATVGGLVGENDPQFATIVQDLRAHGTETGDEFTTGTYPAYQSSGMTSGSTGYDTTQTTTEYPTREVGSSGYDQSSTSQYASTSSTSTPGGDLTSSSGNDYASTGSTARDDVKGMENTAAGETSGTSKSSGGILGKIENMLSGSK